MAVSEPKRRVTIVGATATVELAVLDDGRPRVEVLVPATELGLLVVMAVQQDDVVRLPRNVDEQQRRAAFDADDLDVMSLMGCVLHQASSISTAVSMWPCSPSPGRSAATCSAL